MGNSGSSGGHRRRRHRNHHGNPQSPLPHVPVSQAQPENTTNQYVVTAVMPYPLQYPNPSRSHYHPYTGYYQYSHLHAPLPAPLDHHHRNHTVPYPCGAVQPAPPPYVEHQKTLTIRNDVNLKKETLRVEPDLENPGKYLVAFTFDATVAGSITVVFFAKEGLNCNLISTKESLKPITISFKEGLGQKFRQPSGTGIDLASFNESELKEGIEVYPLAVKAEAYAMESDESGTETPMPGTLNSQVTHALIEKREEDAYWIRVVKQILWVKGVRYELQEIYGINNSVDNGFDGNDPGKECVICLSESRDTTVLPCRHMCMCSGCAKVLRLQTNRCPICRQPIERLLEIKVNNNPEESATD